MRAWGVAVALATVCWWAAAWCALVSVRNVREARRVRSLPPLVEEEIFGADPRPWRIPQSWPDPDAVSDVRVAAAYRDYAEERGTTLTFLGDMTILTGGAALGAAMPSAFGGGWGWWPAVGASFVGAFGFALKHLGRQRWPTIARRYERRRRELAAPSAVRAQPVHPPRARFLRAWDVLRARD